MCSVGNVGYLACRKLGRWDIRDMVCLVCGIFDI